MSKSTITHSEYLHLVGLLALAWKHYAVLKDIEAAVLDITGEEELGHSADAIYSGITADDLLKKLNVSVLPRKKR